MSYILDALKKADSDRDRGHVPTLRDQPLAAGSGTAQQVRSATPWLLALAAATIALLAWLAWRAITPDASPAVELASIAPVPAPRSAVASTPAPDTSAKAEVADNEARPKAQEDDTKARPSLAASAAAEDTLSAAPAATEGTDKPRATMAPAQITPAEPAPKPAKARVEAPPKPKAAEKAAEKAPPKASESNTTQSSSASASKPSSKAAARKPEPDTVMLADLPPSVRQSLPKLVISGATYSDNPAWRMLIINGQVYHEGDKPANDVQLETIRPKSAVLNYKGQRFTQNY